MIIHYGRCRTQGREMKGRRCTMWVYLKTETNLWTVGFYSPDGEWHTDSDWDSSEEAGERCNYLNGGVVKSND